MAEFNVRADAVDVEQIMRQIPRPHSREARGRLHRRADPGAREDPPGEVPGSEGRPLGPARAVPADRPAGRPADVRVRRQDADAIGQPAHRVRPPSAAADPQAVLQPEPARARAARADADQPLPPRARPARRPRLRGHAQPRRRDDADGHRGEEHADARRVGQQPARLQRAPRAGARSRRAVPAGRRQRAAVDAGSRPRPGPGAAAT